MSNYTVAVVAGGKSSRMGTDKSFVPLLGKPLIEHILERTLNLGQDRTIVITNHPEDYTYLELPLFTDVLPDKGALGGIYSVLHYSQSEYTLVLACDMPFINTALLRHIIALREEQSGPYDVIVPRVDGHPQGLHALYSARCRQPIHEDLESNKLKVIGFYERVRVRYVDSTEYSRFDPQGLSFYNVNTPEELRDARRLVNEDPGDSA